MDTDSFTIRLVIGNISVIAILCVIGEMVLPIYHVDPPTCIANLAFASLTGLLGWLIPSPMTKKKEQ